MSFIPEWLDVDECRHGRHDPDVMVVLMSRDMAAMHASSLRFWGVVAGDTRRVRSRLSDQPWLVGVRLKHGMGTVRALGMADTKSARTGNRPRRCRTWDTTQWQG